MRDRYELVANRLKRSIARDWIFVAAASLTLGGSVGALAVGSTSLHSMVTLAAQIPVIPSPTVLLQFEDDADPNTFDDKDLPEGVCEDETEDAEMYAHSTDDGDSAVEVDEEKENLNET
jgi:hypothetical protein